MKLEQTITFELPDIALDQEQYAKELATRLKKLMDDIYKRVYQDLYQICLDALKQDWDDMMDQYYLYKTKRYQRIGVGVGTGTGINLKNAFHWNIDDNHCRVYFDTQFMQPHKQELDGGELDEEGLLDFIMDGNRSVFPVTAKNQQHYNPLEYPSIFRVDVDDNIIDFSISNCTPNEALDAFSEQWKKYAPQKFDELVDKYLQQIDVR